jgi:hypothetical protein
MIIKKKTSLSIEILVLLSLAVAFLSVGIFCGSRLQAVWLDEVVLTDPAVNLSMYGSFTSTTWYHQNAQEFHVSTSFLYTFLLALWIKVVGFSLKTVRLFNYVLMIGSAFFIWLGVKKLKLINFSWLRIALAFSVLFLAGLDFIYTSGRYDTSCILVSSIVFWSFSIKDNKKRWLTIIIAGMFFPLSGIASVVFAVILGAILLIFNFQLFWREFVALMGGFCLGMLFLFALYSINGVWDDFLSMTFGHSVTNTNGKNSLTDLIFSRIGKLFDHTDYLCGGCLQNQSWQILVILLVIWSCYEILTKSFCFRSPYSFGIILATLIPSIMCFLGKYPIYYSWMSVLPLSICLCWSFNNRLEQNPRGIGTKIIGLAFLILFLYANFLGLPSLLILRAKQWEQFDYGKVKNFLANKINKNESIYADFPAFYAVKNQAKQVYFPLYYTQLTEPEKQNLAVIIIDPRPGVRAPWNPGLTEIVGDSLPQWYDTGEQLDTGTYVLKIYRKR